MFLIFLICTNRSRIVGLYGISLLPHCFQSGGTTLHSHQQCMRAPVSPHPHQHLVWCVFLIIAILVDVKGCLTVVLICISLMTEDAEHLFLCFVVLKAQVYLFIPGQWGHLYVIFGEMSLQIFSCFLIWWCVLFLLSCKSSLYTLDPMPFSDLWFAVFSPIPRVVISLFWWCSLKPNFAGV